MYEINTNVHYQCQSNRFVKLEMKFLLASWVALMGIKYGRYSIYNVM